MTAVCPLGHSSFAIAHRPRRRMTATPTAVKITRTSSRYSGILERSNAHDGFDIGGRYSRRLPQLDRDSLTGHRYVGQQEIIRVAGGGSFDAGRARLLQHVATAVDGGRDARGVGDHREFYLRIEREILVLISLQRESGAIRREVGGGRADRRHRVPPG